MGNFRCWPQPPVLRGCKNSFGYVRDNDLAEILRHSPEVDPIRTFALPAIGLYAFLWWMAIASNHANVT